MLLLGCMSNSLGKPRSQQSEMNAVVSLCYYPVKRSHSIFPFLWFIYIQSPEVLSNILMIVVIMFWDWQQRATICTQGNKTKQNSSHGVAMHSDVEGGKAIVSTFVFFTFFFISDLQKLLSERLRFKSSLSHRSSVSDLRPTSLCQFNLPTGLTPIFSGGNGRKKCYICHLQL